MKKTIVLIVAIFIGFNFTYATNDETAENSAATINVSGKILDKTSGEILAGVMVQLNGTDKKAFTDFDGNFTFVNLKPGEYTLNCSLISYEKNELKVDLQKSSEKELKIELKTLN